MLEIIIGSFIGSLLSLVCLVGVILFLYDKTKKNKFKGVKPPNFKRKEFKK